MHKIVVGTTPTFKFIFTEVDPSLIDTAIMTIKDKAGEMVLEKTLDEAVVGSNYISWTLSQAETLLIGKRTVKIMLNWVNRHGVRGVSVEETVVGVPNHIEEVI